MIAAEVLPQYLASHGLFTPECAVEGSLSILPGIGRIGGLRLLRSPGECYFVKQAAEEQDRRMIRREAEVYHWLLGHPAGETPLVPHCYGFAPEQCALILDLDPDAITLHDYCREENGGKPEAAALAAASLARLHRLPWTLPPSTDVSEASLAAWVLELPELDLGTYLSFSSGNLHCVRLLQGEEELCRRLKDLAGEWKVETPIHGDLRFSNMLYHKGGGQKKDRVSLIDWELARPGDPCWDTASIFANYFAAWVQSIPPCATGPDPAGARVPMGLIHAAVQSFWLTYSHYMQFSKEESHRRLMRSMQYAAARLIQYTIEMTIDASTASGHTVLMLQLAGNILDRPEESALLLCGVSNES